ncbi:MAG TPA: hypothetical protein VMH39_08485, partial [Gemmatimonadaceae bacterium]|nr:hypothetical protein [Gemmatimonadaceae bacterium]
KIKEDTHGWLTVSAKEYSEAVPINFGAERIKQIEAASGISSKARAQSIESARRLRHSLLPLNPSDWRRLFLRNGKVFSAPLPELHAMHPALRSQATAKKGAKATVVFAASSLGPATVRLIQALLGTPGVRLGLISEESIDGLPDHVRERLAQHARVEDASDTQQLVAAVRGMSALGQAEMLIATRDELQVPIAEAREALGIPGMRPDVAKKFRDKARMKEILVEAGLPVVRHSLIESVKGGLAFARAVGYPVAIRPRQRMGSAISYRVESEDQLRGLLDGLRPSKDRPVLCEEFVHGQQCSFEVMTIGGIPAWFSASRCRPRRLDAQEDPHARWTITLPREIDDPADAKVRQMGFAALRALGIGSGISTMEWFRRPDGTAVISEITARTPGGELMSLMSHAHGADMHRVWANAVVNGLVAPLPRLYAAGAAFLRGEGHGRRVVAVHGLDTIRKELGAVVVEAYLPRIGKPKSTSIKGEGYVVVRHPETAVVDQALQRIIAGARVQLGELPVKAPAYQPGRGAEMTAAARMA